MWPCITSKTDVKCLVVKGKTVDQGGERETLEEVLARAERAGYEVSERQLKRWRDEGLVPSPQKVGLGRGKGTVAYYPPGTGDLVTAIARELQETRDLPTVAFKLWFEGYPLTSYVRDELLSVFKGHDRRFSAAYRAYEKGLTEKAITEWVDRHRLPRLGSVRGEVGRAEFFHPVLYATRATAGKLSEEELRAELGVSGRSLSFDWYSERSDALRSGFRGLFREAGFEGAAEMTADKEEVPDEELVDWLTHYAEIGRPAAAYEIAREQDPEEWEALRDRAVSLVDRWLPDVEEPEGFACLAFLWLVMLPADRKGPVDRLEEELESDEPLPTDSVEELFRIALGETLQ